jgi:TorA maturation chaperone TorD
VSTPANDLEAAVVVSAEDRARADVYALLGALLAGPPQAQTLKLLRELTVATGSEDGDLTAGWALLKQAAERAEPQTLAEEYHDLFIGLGRGELVPYGSWYVTGFLMERPLAELRVDLARLGFERRAEVFEPEDHVAALCETMSLIIGAEDPVPLDRQWEFFGKHLEPWIGRFFADLRAAQAARFYRAVGLFGERFVEIERTYLSMPA